MDGLLIKEQVKKLSQKYSLPYQTIEKDYALTSLLFVISQFPKLDKVVFKGGTSLKKIHFDNFRFSEDLDFTCSSDISDEFINFMQNNMNNMNFKFTQIKNIERKRSGITFRIMYPQTAQLETSVRLDLSMRGDTFLKPVTKPIMSIYQSAKVFSTI